MKLPSLGHHPHGPGNGNSLHQPPKAWNQNWIFCTFLLASAPSVSSQSNDLCYSSTRVFWQFKVKKRLLSIEHSKDMRQPQSHAETLLALWALSTWSWLGYILCFFFVPNSFMISCSVCTDLFRLALPSIHASLSLLCVFCFVFITQSLYEKKKKKLVSCSSSMLFGLPKSNLNKSLCSHKWFAS